MEFVRGTSNKPQLVVERNSFFRSKGGKNRTYWVCSQRKSKKCNCEIITFKDSMCVRFSNNHSHENNCD